MSSVQSVERALAILRALSSGPAGVTEIAERVDLAKSTVSRMLATLEAAGAVEQVAGGGPYRIGPLIAEIAAAMGPSRSLVEAAAPVLAELAAATGEAAALAVREGNAVHFVFQSVQASEVRVRDWTGTRSPMHVGPTGLVMLAYAARNDVEQYLGGELVAYTPKTVVDPAAIRARLKRIRTAGFEWVFGEFSLELNSVSAPVRDASGAVVAAINLHGPAFRFPPPADRDAVSLRVVDAADRLGRAITPTTTSDLAG